MQKSNMLDMRHLIMTKEDIENATEVLEDPSYSSESFEASTIPNEYEGHFLDGKAKRRLRRAQERKLKKLKSRL